MNTKRLALASISGFAFAFLYDWVLHGILLQNTYKATAHLWRSPEQMESYFPYTVVYQLILVTFIAFIFTKNYENKGIGEGVRFGLIVGLLMGIICFGSYFYMPIDKSLAFTWLAGDLVKGLGLGIIFSLSYRQ